MRKMDQHAAIKSKLGAVAIVICLAGCSDDKPVKAGQALAKVNKQEITVHQLNSEFKQLGPEAGSLARDQLRAKVLDSLVDRQLLLDEALRNKLDRDSEVAQLLDRARAQILAQAYLQRKSVGLPKPTETEISAYFQANPHAYSQRKLVHVKRIVLLASDVTPELESVVASAKSMTEVAAWLDARNVKSIKDQSDRTTGELPEEILGKLGQVMKGTPFFLKYPGNAVIASITLIQEAPLLESEAREEIATLLAVQKSKQKAEAELARLRKDAVIVLYDSADKPAKNTQPLAGKPAKADADSGGVRVERGVAGLK